MNISDRPDRRTPLGFGFFSIGLMIGFVGSPSSSPGR
jgi:hypothetical protein